VSIPRPTSSADGITFKRSPEVSQNAYDLSRELAGMRRARNLRSPFFIFQSRQIESLKKAE
jgi:hypothetical protein